MNHISSDIQIYCYFYFNLAEAVKFALKYIIRNIVQVQLTQPLHTVILHCLICLINTIEK